MNITEFPTLCHRSGSPLMKTILLVVCLCTMATAVTAQQVLVPAPAIPPEQLPQAQETVKTNEYESAYSTATTVARPPQAIQWGPVRFHPHLGYQFLYGNGIQSQPGQTQKTAVNQISPGIGFDLGRFWSLDYTPTIVLYSDPNFQNTVNQLINLTGSASYEAWKFNMAQVCALTSDPQIQTGQQTDQQNYVTTLGAVCQLNNALSLELGVNQNLLFVSQDITNTAGTSLSVGNSLDWSTLDWLNYHWGPNVATAGGVGFGYTHVQVGSDMPYEQVQGRVTWHLAKKVNLSINGGAEFRQFLDSPQSQLISPISRASVTYQPFEQTVLSLNGSRGVNASYFQNLLTQVYDVNLGLSQRLLGKLYLGLTGGYTRTDYKPSGVPNPTDPSIGREDDYTYFSVSLSTLFLKRGTASAYYSLSHNSSNRAGFSYTSDQVGFQLAFRY